jgi:hypothetical protein
MSSAEDHRGREVPEEVTMRRSILVTGIAIALLCAASVASIAWRTRAARSPDPAAAAPGADATPAAAAPMARAASAASPALAAPAPAPAAPAPRGATAPAATPAVATAAPTAISPPPSRALSKFLRRELTARSGELAATLARCTARETVRRQPAVLALEIETLDAEVRIVEARVQARGDASEAAVACAQGALRDRVIAAPPATAGHRNRMPLALTAWEVP